MWVSLLAWLLSKQLSCFYCSWNAFNSHRFLNCPVVCLLYNALFPSHSAAVSCGVSLLLQKLTVPVACLLQKSHCMCFKLSEQLSRGLCMFCIFCFDLLRQLHIMDDEKLWGRELQQLLVFVRAGVRVVGGVWHRELEQQVTLICYFSTLNYEKSQLRDVR